MKTFNRFLFIQALGALNDNLIKNALITFLIYQGASLGLTELYGHTISLPLLSNGASALFILPFMLFASLSTDCARHFVKQKIIFYVKLLEFFIGILVASCCYLLFLTDNLTDSLKLICLLGFALSIFALGLHSTFFGPVKYSIVPELVPHQQLMKANSHLEAFTFLSILMGTILGSLLGSSFLGLFVLLALSMTLSLMGVYLNRRIPQLNPEAATPFHSRVPTSIFKMLKLTRATPSIFNSTLAISWFWLYGSIILSHLPILAKQVFAADNTLLMLFLVMFSIGIALGSLAAEKASRQHIEIGLVPLGSFGMSCAGLFLAHLTPVGQSILDVPLSTLSAWLFSFSDAYLYLLSLFALGFFGGLFIVPLYAFLQTRDPDNKTIYIGANNFLNALFMVLGAIISIVIGQFFDQLYALFYIAAILNIIVACYIYTVVPEFLLRFVGWFIARVMYRLRIEGLDHLDFSKPAVLTCNHVSFVDAVVLVASLPKPVRFVMDHKIFKIPGLNTFFKHFKAIPIASQKENPQMLENAFSHIQQALDDGQWVVIFPEGKITSDGKMNPFRPGIQRILQSNPVAVYPMALSGLWGSFFSRIEKGQAMVKPFRRGFYSRVRLAVGKPFEPAASIDLNALEQQTLALMNPTDAQLAKGQHPSQTPNQTTH